jgi:hypothetical protein
MSLRSKPLLQCRSCKPCSALMRAARRYGPRRLCPQIMSLCSKPLLQSCKPCSALMRAARRSGPRRLCPQIMSLCSKPLLQSCKPCSALMRAARRSGPRRLCPQIMSLRSKPLLQCRSTEPCSAISTGKSACATFRLILEQTDNYFTSKAPAVIGEEC